MANQYTKKAAEKVKREQRRAKKQEPDMSGIKIVPIDPEILGKIFNGLNTPLMNKADAKAKSVPHFTLLPSDNFTTGLVREWIRLAQAHGTPEAKILEAKQILANIEKWRTENPTACKTPD